MFMKKIKTGIIAICLLFAFAVKANAASIESTESYYVNDLQVEMLMANSTDVSLLASQSLSGNDLLSSNLQTNAGNNAAFKAGGKSAVVAILLDFFLGGLGVHRAYLGTKTFTWIGYILTCGGIFGIVPLVDLVVMIVNAGDISAYEGNDKFFMW